LSTAPESAPADITVNRSGSLEINAGNLTSTATDTSGSNRSIAGFTNGVVSHELYGVYAQGGGDFNLTNDGDITLNTGTRLAESSSVGGRAESNAATPFGAVIGMTRAVDGVTLLQKTEQQFNNVTIRQTGDIMANVETVHVDASAMTQIGEDPAQAAVRLNSSLHAPISGVLIESGLNVDAVFDGNVTIDSGTSLATANALAGPDTSRGLVTGNVNGANVNGIRARVIGDFTEGDTLNDSMAEFLITGDVSVTGGSINSLFAGSGLAPASVQDFPPPSGASPASISETGGYATGIFIAEFADEKTVQVFGSSSREIDLVDRINIGLGGDVSAQGGSVTTSLTGGNLAGVFTGGRALAMTTGFSSVTLDVAPDTDFTASGGAVDLTLTGGHGLINAFGGDGRGVIAQLLSDTDVAFDTDVSSAGGAVTITGDAGEGSLAVGGNSLGAQLILDDRYFASEYAALPEAIKDQLAARQILVTGEIVAKGGDATALDPDVVATGGDAIGLQANTATVLGTVTATAGFGTNRRGAVAGVEFETSFNPGFIPLDVIYATLRIGGTVEAYGEGVDVADSSAEYSPVNGSSGNYDTTESMSAGVRFSGFGNQGVEILDGGSVSAHGNHVHGIVVANEVSTIRLESGSVVETDGENASGIEVRPYFQPSFSLGDAQGSIAHIIVEDGASLTSQQGTAIHDEERVAMVISQSGPLGIEAYDNQTNVDVAGTVTGGGGTAIDLGTGSDSLTLRASAVVTGEVLLGTGSDRFAFEDGYLFPQIVDGGDDEDFLVADVSDGDTRTFDVQNLSVTNFEVIEKLGQGTVNLAGDPLADAWRLDARGGLTTVGDGYGNLDAMIFDGAEVSTDFILGDVVTDGTGRLSGNATIANLTNNGVIAPGNSIGTITVTGDAAFNAGSVYEVEIEAPDQSDLIDVAGTATIDSGSLEIIRLSPDQSYVGGQTYRIIEAGDVVVNSGFVFDEPFSLLTTELVYGADYVDLVLSTNIPLQDFAETRNQRAAARGLNDLAQTGDALAVFNELYMLDPEDAPMAFDLASGEIHASVHHLVREGSELFASTLRNQAVAGLASGAAVGMSGGPALGYFDDGQSGSPFDSVADRRIRGAWGGLIGSAGDIGGDGNAAQIDMRTGGVVGGYHSQGMFGGGTFVAGFGAGYLAGHSTVDERLSEADTDSANIGAYGAWTDGDWTFSASSTYTATYVSTERRIVFGGIDRTAEAGYWTHTFAIDAEAARAFDLGGFELSPLVSLNAGRSGH
ncbi:MAG: autotransporter domain-containing protein, partial [Rhizobiaceae bacterium]|nr:autotransporter domain-containing protein [Rhizobiaceae bacterium]